MALLLGQHPKNTRGASPHVIQLTEVQRRLGWLMSVAGTLLILGQTARIVDTGPSFALWWRVLSFTVIILIVVNALFGLLLPLRVLRVGWIVVPTLGFFTQLLTFQGYQGDLAGTIFPWEWTLSTVFVSYLVLIVKPKAAVVIAFISGFIPAASGLLAFGMIPEATALQTPIQISNFVFTVIYIGIQAQLQRLHSSELAAKTQEERKLRAQVETARQKTFARVVHDDVLATLSAAQRFSDDVPDLLKSHVKQTLTVLDASVFRVEGTTQLDTLVEEIRAIVHGFDEECSFELVSHSGVIPGEVSEAMLAALSEALRNSVRHAGSESKRRVSGLVSTEEVRIEIWDDGIGFDLAGIRTDRLGVRDSILGRIRELKGGSAEVATQVGQGTTVTLKWLL